MPLDAQQPQKDLLVELGHVLDVSEAGRKKPPEPPAALGGDGSDEAAGVHGTLER